MKRKPTKAQQEAAAERRSKFRALAQKVAALSVEERTNLMLSVGAVMTCTHRTLSIFNTCLLISQLATVSMVGGFQQWKKAGRCVRKGEHGMGIWIPTAMASDDGGETPSASDVSDEKKMFYMGTVFDISQTEELKAENENE